MVKRRPLSCCLAIHLAAVADGVDTHAPVRVVNLVKDAVIADTDAPVVLGTGDLAAPLRLRVPGQLFDFGNDSFEHF